MRDYFDIWNDPWGRETGERHPSEIGQWMLPPIHRLGLREQLPLVSDVQEDDQSYLIAVEIPGVSKDDIRVEVLENRIRITGERKQTRVLKSQQRSERFYGRFERSFSLPSSIDADGIHARYENGVLEIEVPKAEAARPRNIEIGTEQSTSFLDKLTGRPSPSEGNVNVQQKAKPH